LIDDTGMVIEFDDDDGVGFMPGLNLVDLGAGTYTLAVSGFDDGGVDEDTVVFDGLQDDGSPHPEDFEYKLSIAVNVIPAPGAATLAGLAGFAAIRRRR
jgi:uncharacterized protein (TIGR03382 family)